MVYSRNSYWTHRSQSELDDWQDSFNRTGIWLFHHSNSVKSVGHNLFSSRTTKRKLLPAFQMYNKMSVRTVDSDVMILTVMAAQRLNIGELWFHFATGRNFRFLAAHSMAKTLGPNKCLSLPYFHVFAVSCS